MKSANTLLKLRNIINDLDTNLINLLSKRKKIAVKIAKIKIKEKYPIKDIEREQLLLNNLITLGETYNLEKKYIYNLFQIIIKNSISVQNNWIKNNYYETKKLKTFSFLGDLGSYSYYAAKKYANKKLKFFSRNYCKNFQEIIKNVENEQSDYAILPIENNSSGSIDETYTVLKNTKLFIVDEINVPINHCLLSQKNTQFIDIKVIYSHKQPFIQCNEFIKHFPNWKLKHTESTTKAIQKVSQDKNFFFAALGSESCAKIYQLKIIAKNISNFKKNITRFIILRKKKQNIPIYIPSITTIMVLIKKNKKIVEIIVTILKEHNLKIRQLKSHICSKLSSNIAIFIDINSHINTNQMQQTLKKLKEVTLIKILGCYPLDKYPL
ncbi:MAG: chorismate mutase [Buchnera aphidicola (Nurudea yanoniella)]